MCLEDSLDHPPIATTIASTVEALIVELPLHYHHLHHRPTTSPLPNYAGNLATTIESSPLPLDRHLFPSSNITIGSSTLLKLSLSSLFITKTSRCSLWLWTSTLVTGAIATRRHHLPSLALLLLPFIVMTITMPSPFIIGTIATAKTLYEQRGHGSMDRVVLFVDHTTSPQ